MCTYAIYACAREGLFHPERRQEMRESTIEKKFCAEIKKGRGLCIKLVSPSMNGLPDRLVLLPNGRVAFVEFKAPGEKMRPLQLIRKKLLESLGFAVYCIDCMEMVDYVCKVLLG